MEIPDNIESISVLIPDGEPWDVVKVLRCFSQIRGIKIYILLRSRLSLAQFSRYCAGSYFHRSKNDEEWVNEIRKLVERFKIDIVMPTTLKGIKFVSRNKQTIAQFAAVPPIADAEQIEMSNNKWEFYKCLKKTGLPVLKTVYVGKAGEAIENPSIINSVEFPALLKPLSQKSGAGIVRVETSLDLESAWSGGKLMKGRPYILQSFIDAERFSLSVCCKDGVIIAYTLQRVFIPSKDPYQPGSTVEYIYDEEVFNAGKRLLEAMKWNGIADMDILVDKQDQTVYVLEFNPRLWQSLLGSLIAGVNIPYIWSLSALGINISCNQREAVRYTRPASFIKMMLSRIIGRRPPIKMRWKECDLQFTVRDPLPELFDIVLKPVIWYRIKCLTG
jgi:predicted ATP-grasp superfamily ATP-dependent carboligase